MTETTDNATLAPDQDDWLSDQPVEGAAPRRTLAMRAGLIAAGAVVGGLVVTSVHHDSSASATGPASFAGPLGAGQLPGGIPGGGGLGGPGGVGGLAGEQRLSGTLVSIGSSSVTVRTPSGTATYAVTSATEIVRDGQTASLGALQPGDPVFLDVYPSGTGSGLAVERLFAGTQI